MAGGPWVENIFVSYSRKDEGLVLPVIGAQFFLRNAFYVDINAAPGIDWRAEHDEKIIEAGIDSYFVRQKNAATSGQCRSRDFSRFENDVAIIPVLLDDTELPGPLVNINTVNLRKLKGCGPTSDICIGQCDSLWCGCSGLRCGHRLRVQHVAFKRTWNPRCGIVSHRAGQSLLD